jgi:hypothetical protein
MKTKQFKYNFQIPITCILVEDVENFYNKHYDMTRFFYCDSADLFIDTYYKDNNVNDYQPGSWSGLITQGLVLDDDVNFSNDIDHDAESLILGVKDNDGFPILLQSRYVWINFVGNVDLAADKTILQQIDENFKLKTQTDEIIIKEYWSIINIIHNKLLDRYFQDNRFHVFHKFNDRNHAIEYAKELQKEIQSKDEFTINLNYANYE